MENIIQPLDIGQYLNAPEYNGWAYNELGFLIKEFKFKNFSESFAFMTRIAMLCEKFNHHPEWTNNYNIV